MRIRLMANIPDQFVARCVEYVMESHSEFDDAKPGSEMTACIRDCVDRLGTQFCCNLLEVSSINPAQICRGFDRIEEFASHRWITSLFGCHRGSPLRNIGRGPSSPPSKKQTEYAIHSDLHHE